MHWYYSDYIMFHSIEYYKVTTKDYISIIRMKKTVKNIGINSNKSKEVCNPLCLKIYLLIPCLSTTVFYLQII